MSPAAAPRIRRPSAATLAAAAIAVPLAVLITLIAVRWGPLMSFDRWTVDQIKDAVADSAGLRSTARWFAVVSHPNAVLVAAAIGAIVLWLNSQRRAAVWTLGVVLGARLVSLILKPTINRPRPFDGTHDSFPSGHATAIAAGATVLIVLVSIFIRRRGLRRLTVGGALAAVFLVGVDRLVLAAHYPTDVIAGWALGALVAAIGFALYDPHPKLIAATSEPLARFTLSNINRLGVVVNPTKVPDPGQFRSMVRSVAADAGIDDVLFWETTAEDPGRSMAHDAAVGGSTIVLAVGGDGTLRSVCEELAGTGIAVGIVPAGTGNLFARNLDIPLYLRAAVDVAINGQDRAVDMVEVTGDHMEPSTFLVMAGLGLDAALMQGVNEDIKAKVGWLAYFWSGLKSLMFPAVRVEISVDGGPFTKHRARTVVVGNVGYLQAGMPLIPNATVDDGRLDVVVLYPARFWSWLPLIARVLARDPRTDETITRMSGRTVTVRTSADAPRQLDGDPIASGRELTATCVHGRLLVRVPR